MHIKSVMAFLSVVVASSTVTLAIEHAVRPTQARAEQGVSALQDYVIYAGPRRDTEKDESFIFINPKTGDIWVYESADVKEHYRITTIGQKLEEVRR